MIDRTDKKTFKDKQDIFFSDLFTNLNKHPSTGMLAKVTNSNSIKQAIKNIVLTNHGERLYQPILGGNVKASLFEPIDNFTTEDLTTSIQRTIFNCEPRVGSLQVLVKPDQINNLYNVTINYTEKNDRAVQSVDLVLIRNR